MPKGLDEHFDLFSNTIDLSVACMDWLSDYQVLQFYYKLFRSDRGTCVPLQETHGVHLLGNYCVEVLFNLVVCFILFV